MKGYEIDKDTGYLTPLITDLPRGFTAKAKQVFLEAFRTTGNMSKSAEIAGVTRNIVQDHLEQDSAFYISYHMAVNFLCDYAEENLVKAFKRNPTACFGFLRSYRGHIWGDKKTTDNKKNDDKLKKLLDQAEKDANK
jgi:hypothetical protein